MVIDRFDVCLVNLDPTVGSEIRKTRPCLVISPDEMNHHIRTVIVAPMTTKGKPSPSRAKCKFLGKSGLIVFDQIRTIDSNRIVKRLGRINKQTETRVLDLLSEIFAP